MSAIPTSVEEIRKNPKMMEAYLAYLKKSHALNEFTFMMKKGDNYKNLWENYLSPKSPSMVNVSSQVATPAKVLAERGDWTNPAWAKIIATGQAEVQKTMRDGLRDFGVSKEFKEFLLKNKVGDHNKAAKLLGISDVKKLKAMMEAKAVGDEKLFKKLWGELAKKEKELMKCELMWKNMDQYF